MAQTFKWDKYPQKKEIRKGAKSFWQHWKDSSPWWWEILHQIAFHEPRPARIITVIFKTFQSFLGHRCPTDARWLCWTESLWKQSQRLWYTFDSQKSRTTGCPYVTLKPASTHLLGPSTIFLLTSSVLFEWVLAPLVGDLPGSALKKQI